MPTRNLSASDIIRTWKSDRAVRATFGSFSEFAAYLARPTLTSKKKLEEWRAYFDGATNLTEEELLTDPNLSIEERSRQNWEASPDIRREFNQNFEAYLACRRATEKKMTATAGRRINGIGLRPEDRPDEDTNLTIEVRAKKVWDTSPTIRAEFRKFETYLAYRRSVEGKRIGRF